MKTFLTSAPFRLWIWFNFRRLGLHWRRTLAVLLGIGLGAAVFTSMRLAVNASLDSFTRSVDAITGKADLSIMYPGGRVTDGIVPELLKLPTVRTASPILTAYVRTERADSQPFLLVGIDPLLDRPLHRAERSQSDASSPSSAWVDLIARPFTLLAGEGLAKVDGIKPGTCIPLRHISREENFCVLDATAHGGISLAEGGRVAITDFSTMQEFMGLQGMADRIDLLLQPGATKGDIARIRALLPKGVLLTEPGESRESGRLMIRSYELNLSVLSFVSLFVGMFLVYSMVSLHATSRRHELAVLRSIGAPARLIFFLFLVEGGFFGIAGWATAIPLGSLLVKQLLFRVSSTISLLFVRVQPDRLTLDTGELILSFGITIFISLLAVFQPAREAMQIPPKDALLMKEASSTPNPAGRLAVYGLILLALCRPLSAVPAVWGIPLSGYLATFFLFCGFALLSPWCLRFAGARLSPVLGKLFGQPAYLGARYLRDSGIRAAISVGAFITAIALFVSLSIMVHSFRETVQAWATQTISGDLFLRPRMADMNQYRDPLPKETVAAIRELRPAVEILPYRRIYLHSGGIPFQFEAIDFDAFVKHARYLLLEGDMREALPMLLRGEGVVVSEVFANQTGIRSGNRFRAQIEGVRFDLPVLGVFRDYRTQGGVVEYSLPHFVERTGDASWSGARLFITDGHPDRKAAAGRLRNELLFKLGQESQAIETTLGEELRGAILRIFDETFAITTALLLIALFIAGLGVATTLTVLVLERARELNTLLAIGASRLQIRAMICWEALLMVLCGEALGLACGFFLSSILIFVINRQSFGWTFIYSVDWLSLAISFPVILFTALAAALPAGRMLFKQSPSMAMRES